MSLISKDLRADLHMHKAIGPLTGLSGGNN